MKVRNSFSVTTVAEGGSREVLAVNMNNVTRLELFTTHDGRTSGTAYFLGSSEPITLRSEEVPALLKTLGQDR